MGVGNCSEPCKIAGKGEQFPQFAHAHWSKYPNEQFPRGTNIELNLYLRQKSRQCTRLSLYISFSVEIASLHSKCLPSSSTFCTFDTPARNRINAWILRKRIFFLVLSKYLSEYWSTQITDFLLSAVLSFRMEMFRQIGSPSRHSSAVHSIVFGIPGSYFLADAWDNYPTKQERTCASVASGWHQFQPVPQAVQNFVQMHDWTGIHRYVSMKFCIVSYKNEWTEHQAFILFCFVRPRFPFRTPISFILPFRG